MARTKRILLGTLLGGGLLLVPVAGVPFAAAGNPCFHGYDIPPLNVGAGTNVRTEPCAFEPTITVVEAGETVTFRNDGDMPHLVTGANGEWGNREVELAPGKTVAYTFANPGVYPYACAFHPGMTGAIVVGDGGPALAATISAAAGSGGGTSAQGSTTEGDATAAGATDQASATTPVAPNQPDPIVVVLSGLLVALALGLAVVALAARGRTRRGEAASTIAGAPEPLTR